MLQIISNLKKIVRNPCILFFNIKPIVRQGGKKLCIKGTFTLTAFTHTPVSSILVSWLMQTKDIDHSPEFCHFPLP